MIKYIFLAIVLALGTIGVGVVAAQQVDEPVSVRADGTEISNEDILKGEYLLSLELKTATKQLPENNSHYRITTEKGVYYTSDYSFLDSKSCIEVDNKVIFCGSFIIESI